MGRWIYARYVFRCARKACPQERTGRTRYACVRELEARGTEAEEGSREVENEPRSGTEREGGAEDGAGRR